MKKVVVFIGILFICVGANAQKRNNFGELYKKTLTLNSGAVFHEGDTIRIGTPKDNAERYSYIFEPKYLLGLAGGDNVEAYKLQNSRILIHYFQTGKDKNTGEKTFIAALGYGREESVYLCDIAQAVEWGEVVASGVTPKKSTVKKAATVVAPVISTEKNDEEQARIQEEKRKLQEEKERFEAEKEQLKKEREQAEEAKKQQDKENKERAKAEQKLKEKEAKAKKAAEKAEKKTEVVAPAVSTKTSNSATLLEKINQLKKSKDISDAEHYQLLKAVTGSDENIENKKELVKKLQNLRNSNKLSISDYDEIINYIL